MDPKGGVRPVTISRTRGRPPHAPPSFEGETFEKSFEQKDNQPLIAIPPMASSLPSNPSHNFKSMLPWLATLGTKVLAKGQVSEASMALFSHHPSLSLSEKL